MKHQRREKQAVHAAWSHYKLEGCQSNLGLMWLECAQIAVIAGTSHFGWNVTLMWIQCWSNVRIAATKVSCIIYNFTWCMMNIVQPWLVRQCTAFALFLINNHNDHDTYGIPGAVSVPTECWFVRQHINSNHVSTRRLSNACIETSMVTWH